MLTKRQRDILNVLEREEGVITVARLAEKCGISSRTVHSDLRVIESQLLGSGYDLVKKRGVGILLKSHPNWPASQAMSPKADDDIQIRRRKIMALILFGTEPISFNHMAELFFVSKTSIINDMAVIRRIFEGGTDVLPLLSDSKGTRLVGKESDIQKAYLHFNRYILAQHKQEGSNFQQASSQLEPFYGQALVKTCRNLLYSYVRENIMAMSDYYLQNVLNLFIILVYRMNRGYHIEDEGFQEKREGEDFFHESAVKLIHRSSLRLGFDYQNSDIAYLSAHLVANRFEDLERDITQEAHLSKILDQIATSLMVKLTENEDLLAQLKHHLALMIYRLRAGDSIDNPFTEQVKREFPLTFNVIWLVLSKYELDLGIRLTEDEVAFLTIYFQSVIEQARMNQKILIICQMGLATSELLINRIKNNIPSLDSFEVSSVGELDSLDLDQFDLMISTVPIDLPSHRVIEVSPFLNRRDIDKIRQAGYGQWGAKQDRERGRDLQRLGSRLKLESIYLDSNFSSKEELLTQIGGHLVTQGIVTEDFIADLFQREKSGGTDLPVGVAIPHGNPHHVKESRVVLLKNKKKFKWQDYYVDIVFILCLAKEDTKESRSLLADIYHIIDSSTMLGRMRSAPSEQALLEQIGGIHYDG